MAVVALEGVLVGRIALPPAAAQVLHRVEKEVDAGDPRQLQPQPRYHRQARVRALRHRLEVDEHEAPAGARAAGEGNTVTGLDPLAVDFDHACGGDRIDVAVGLSFPRQFLAGFEGRARNTGVGPDFERPVIALA